MTRLLLACLLSLGYLLPRPATSQVAPLAPRVVRLEAGDVVRGPLIGLDTATYTSARRYVAGAGQLLALRSQRLAEASRLHQLDSLTLATTADELRRCRATAAGSEADYQRLAGVAQKVAGKPPARPLLLDWHFWFGVLAGGAGGAAWGLTR